MLLRSIFLAGLMVSTSFADINVVTDRSDFHLKGLFQSFTENTGINVNAVYLKKGTIPARIESGADDVDVIIATDIVTLTKLATENRLQSMSSDVIDLLDKKFVGPDSEYVALSFRARAVVHSKSRVNGNELVGYEALADIKYRGRVCMRPFLHTYNIAFISEMIVDRGEEFARNWVRGVRANLAVAPSGNDRKQARLIASGICDISLMNTYYFDLMLANDEQREIANSVQLYFPYQDRGGAYVLYSGAAISSQSDNIDEAQRFIDFLLGSEAQVMISDVMFEYSVIDIPVGIKFNFVSPVMIFENRKLAVEILAE